MRVERDTALSKWDWLQSVLKVKEIIGTFLAAELCELLIGRDFAAAAADNTVGTEPCEGQCCFNEVSERQKTNLSHHVSMICAEHKKKAGSFAIVRAMFKCAQSLNAQIKSLTNVPEARIGVKEQLSVQFKAVNSTRDQSTLQVEEILLVSQCVLNPVANAPNMRTEVSRLTFKLTAKMCATE